VGRSHRDVAAVGGDDKALPGESLEVQQRGTAFDRSGERWLTATRSTSAGTPPRRCTSIEGSTSTVPSVPLISREFPQG
jgi:hypothetical protein